MSKSLSIGEFLDYTVPFLINKNSTVIFKPDLMGEV